MKLKILFSVEGLKIKIQTEECVKFVYETGY